MTPSPIHARLAVGLCVLLLATGTAAATDSPAGPWRSTEHADHPLVGQIWSVREQKPIAASALIDDLAGAGAVLLGEIHDNPDHHALQGWIVGGIAARGRRPAIVFEMIPENYAEPLARYLANPTDGAAGLGPALKWTERGWPDWTMYQPIAEAALAAGLAIKPGDLSRETTRRIGREGLDVLDADDRARIGVDRPLEDARREALLDKLFEGHCGLMPKQALTPMLNVQRARDAAMADAVLTEAERDGAVLIAGAGHVRADWAVPWYLHARAPKLTVRTLAFIEADPESMAATDYFPPAIDGDLAYDYVWFTPRGTVIDHCAKLKERFSKTPMNHEKPAD